ncbi:MAG: hypothetical protein CMN21_05505 [Rubinisphaera sp.]|uniref:hypothetical protein n=1 Tax=Rubinisphaera sp. TaxID=2024857 RepID=UPI000C1217E5|nr:hypothetical protein [Rubinisphaera sp.]MBV08660.1 hypothetical protein [Rubinisphaera sp.]
MTDAQPTSPEGLLSSSDFFFTTRIVDTATALSKSVHVASDITAIHKKLEHRHIGLWMIDLDTAESILSEVADLTANYPDLQVIAFGSHVEVARLKKARQAGCHLVVPRSKMTTDLVEYLQKYLNG